MIWAMCFCLQGCYSFISAAALGVLIWLVRRQSRQEKFGGFFTKRKKPVIWLSVPNKKSVFLNTYRRNISQALPKIGL